MAFYEWVSLYSVGIPSIDEQHKQIISIINEAHRVLVNDEGPEGYLRVLTDLMGYTIAHFAYEERLLKEHGYSAYAEHKSEHEKLTTDIISYVNKLRAGFRMDGIDILAFVLDWLEDHIVESDGEYGDFLRARGVT